ncbi:Ig-like domain-containing protein [Octadecabacter sp. 1_MG-2023]|uniref:Ig-like domain-containing protein n=1 Tax=unclassified Octadecabacter TaxID=196158 RepID=UPI001C09AB28|nr:MULTISPECIES: Ig-like domain-containing protein [unclassified Octadecabacter]MBU2994056.1 cadherin-like domain-containing protein [Octadecabacter sp. B2R22]MDO6736090.1 Ig-like domain-containing protein [Octadecabacter sp. 1_MG-2023]
MQMLTDPYGLTIGWAHLLLKAQLPVGNQPPIAVNDEVSVDRWDGSVTLDVMANDVDPEGGVLTLIAAAATHGQAVVEPNGTIIYTPPSGSDAADTISYTIADPEGAQASAAVTVTIVDPQISISPDDSNYLVGNAQDGLLEVTITTPDIFAGTYQVDLTNLAAGPISVLDPLISGLADQGEVLTADALWIYDPDNGVPTISYQWMRDGVAISGEVAQTYTVTNADVGTTLSVISTATDANGTNLTTSAPQLILGSVNADSYTNANPLFSAHRGNLMMNKEYTLEGARAAFDSGVVGVDSDVYSLSDGALAVTHDADVSLMTDGTGDVSTFDTASWRALTIDTTENTFNSGAASPILQGDLISAFGNEAIYTPQIKADGADITLVSEFVSAGIGFKNALVGSFDLNHLTGTGKAIDKGYESLILVSSGTGLLSAAQSAGVGWVGLRSDNSQATTDDWANAGFKVMFWTVNRRHRAAELLAYNSNVIGFWSDDATYLQGANTVTQDTWDNGLWMTGMLHHSEPLDAGISIGNRSAVRRGTILTGGYFGWAAPANGQKDYVLQGWATASEDKANDDYVLNVTVRFDQTANNTSEWMAVALHDDALGDLPYSDAAGQSDNAYNVLFRKDGRAQIYRPSDTGNTLKATYNGAAFATGEEGTYRITVTPASVTIDRMNGDSVIGTATTNDTAGRGGYFSFGRFGMCGAFKNVSVIRN